MQPNLTYGAPASGASVTANYSATSGQTTSILGANAVRLVSTTDCFVDIGLDPVATNSDMFLPAGVPEYFSLPPGGKVSAIQVSAAGTIYATPIV